MKRLHCYAQRCPHDDCFIVGDVMALSALRNAIDEALRNGEGSMISFDSDGEGYYTLVFRRDDPEAWDTQYRAPSQDDRERFDPVALIEPGKYERLISAARFRP
jgi:hypothetical protein